MLRMARLWLSMLTTALVLSAADPFLGTWKLNTTKSSFSAGWPGPQRRTVVVRQDGEWFGQDTDAVNAAGQTVTSTNRFRFDGKKHEYRATNGTTAKATAKRTDDYHIEWVFTDSTGAVTKGRTIISKDGKTRTDTLKGTSPRGQPVNNTAVYDKQ